MCTTVASSCLLFEAAIQGIQWTVRFDHLALGYMQIEHGVGDVGMTQKLLQGNDIQPIFQKVRCPAKEAG